MQTCKDCLFFDAEYGDCHNCYSPRFQTKAEDAACDSFHSDAPSLFESTYGPLTNALLADWREQNKEPK